MPRQDMESARGAALIEIGRTGIAHGDEKALDAYFSQEGDYIFHGPDGDMDYAGLKKFFAMMRNALEGYSCERHDLIVKDNMIGARTVMAGRFTGTIDSPYGPIQLNGKDVSLEIVNFFRYKDNGKLVEEWVQYDNLGWYEQLGLNLQP